MLETEDNLFYNIIGTMDLNDLDETGFLEITNYIAENESILVIVSPSKGPADYTFEVVRK